MVGRVYFVNLGVKVSTNSKIRYAHKEQNVMGCRTVNSWIYSSVIMENFCARSRVGIAHTLSWSSGTRLIYFESTECAGVTEYQVNRSRAHQINSHFLAVITALLDQFSEWPDIRLNSSKPNFFRLTVYPVGDAFTPKSDPFQISPVASPEILHHTV